MINQNLIRKKMEKIMDLSQFEILLEKCGEVNHQPLPTENYYDNKKTWEYIPYDFYEFKRDLDYLKEHFKQHKHFVELGCGIGTKTIYANMINYKATGFDFDKKLLRISNNLSNLYYQERQPTFKFMDLSTEEFFNYAKTLDKTIIYFYSPFAYENSAKWIIKLVKNLQVGNIIYPRLHCENERKAFEELVKSKNLKDLSKDNYSVKYYMVI